MKDEPEEGVRLLVVDDEETMLRATSRVLERLGYRVTSCNSGSSALPLCTERRESFALVLTDFNMPGMSGVEFTEAVRKAGFTGPLMLSSGYITEELRRQADGIGVQEILRKPATVEELSGAVHRLLNATP